MSRVISVYLLCKFRAPVSVLLEKETSKSSLNRYIVLFHVQIYHIIDDETQDLGDCPPSRPLWVMVIVLRLRGNIIRTAVVVGSR